MFHLRYDHQTEENPHVAVFAEQKSDGQEAAYSRSGCAVLHGCVNQINVVQLKVCMFLICLSITGSNQAYRAISTGQLNALLRLHLRPIDVVVFHGPQGDLVLRGASRLDAFSGYPVRS